MAAVRGRLSSLPGLENARVYHLAHSRHPIHVVVIGGGIEEHFPMVKKIVPDPPLPSTSTRPFGRCDAGHDPLFTVNPNISAEDALVHVALYLRSAYETGYKALDYMREEGRGMFWSNLHAIEMAEGVVEAILDGIESTPPPRK